MDAGLPAGHEILNREPASAPLIRLRRRLPSSLFFRGKTAGLGGWCQTSTSREGRFARAPPRSKRWPQQSFDRRETHSGTGNPSRRIDTIEKNTSHLARLLQIWLSRHCAAVATGNLRNPLVFSAEWRGVSSARRSRAPGYGPSGHGHAYGGRLSWPWPWPAPPCPGPGRVAFQRRRHFSLKTREFIRGLPGTSGDRRIHEPRARAKSGREAGDAVAKRDHSALPMSIPAIHTTSRRGEKTQRPAHE